MRQLPKSLMSTLHFITNLTDSSLAGWNWNVFAVNLLCVSAAAI